MSNNVSEVLQIENCIRIYYTRCMKLKKNYPTELQWERLLAGALGALLNADLQPAS